MVKTAIGYAISKCHPLHNDGNRYINNNMKYHTSAEGCEKCGKKKQKPLSKGVLCSLMVNQMCYRQSIASVQTPSRQSPTELVLTSLEWLILIRMIMC